MLNHLAGLFATTSFNLRYNTLHDLLALRQHAGESGSAYVARVRQARANWVATIPAHTAATPFG